MDDKERYAKEINTLPDDTQSAIDEINRRIVNICSNLLERFDSLENKYERGITISNNTKSINLRGWTPSPEQIEALIKWVANDDKKMGF